jgi:hypothetical protein
MLTANGQWQAGAVLHKQFIELPATEAKLVAASSMI